MHTSPRRVGDKDEEENSDLCMEAKIKQIWRLIRFASDSNALAVSRIVMLLIGIKEKRKAL